MPIDGHMTATFRAIPALHTLGLDRLVLGLVWLAVASGAVVFSEPAPVDVLTAAAIAALPLVGLVRLPAPLYVYLGLWLVVGAGGFLATTMSPGLIKPATHTTISVYLCVASFIFAGFVAKRPVEHTRLVLHAYLWAAFVAAVAGIIGYFGLVPGAGEIFTKFGRATGTFKDPNVFGPFLVAPFLYALHLALHRSVRGMIVPLVMAALLAFAVLLSFSRGAWFALAAALAIFLYVSFVRAPSSVQRVRIVVLGMVGAGLVAIVVVAALQFESVAKLLAERASVTQSYDVGPEGRFGGQEKARRLILENPLGIGASVFSTVHHHEDVHNVYLSMFLNAGWLGGLFYALVVALTVLLGLRHAFRRTAAQPLYLVVVAAFVGHAAEGFVIDTDHWRHFYLLMGLAWGLMFADLRGAGRAARDFSPRLQFGLRRSLVR